MGRCTKLREVSLGHNKLTGNLTSISLFTFSNLISLTYEKIIVGSIPESLGRCVGLTTLSLSDNRLSGIIFLFYLILFCLNDLLGEFPECLEKWVNLQKLLLDNNQFSGMILNF